MLSTEEKLILCNYQNRQMFLKRDFKIFSLKDKAVTFFCFFPFVGIVCYISTRHGEDESPSWKPIGNGTLLKNPQKLGFIHFFNTKIM